MKLIAMIALGVLAAPDLSIESRSLLTGPEGGKQTDVLLMERIATRDRIVVKSRTVSPNGSLSLSQSEYTSNGTPVSTWQEGFWNDRWNHFETRYEREGAVQDINAEITKSKEKASEFRNPTVLWFWRTMPKVGESVVVHFLAQNVIAKFDIRYTYEGDEEMTLAGRKVKLHRVREDPLSAKGVYTLWWYDDKGMGVRRFHKTTQHEFTYDLKAWN